MFRRNRVPLYTSKGCSRDEENDLTKMDKQCKFPEPFACDESCCNEAKEERGQCDALYKESPTSTSPSSSTPISPSSSTPSPVDLSTEFDADGNAALDVPKMPLALVAFAVLLMI
ncbi:hypothetical protein niasHS_009357 [Heterodera schachtii]|uniref:Uncharacterized protein n=1 Tax=Heterodera schachtii TaxID=97005 RepID=A0ABD2JBS3_HETSC